MSLVTDITTLLKIGEYFLPERAGVHMDAANALAGVDAGSSLLFVGNGTQNKSHTETYAEWVELLTLVHSVVATTAVNLRDAGTGIVDAANAFAEADTSNAGTIDAVAQEMSEYEHGNQDEGGSVQPHTKPDPVGELEEFDVVERTSEGPPTTPADEQCPNVGG